MSKHSQRPDKSVLVCTNCKNGDCNECVDVLRMIYSDTPICKCDRQGHSGDPVNNQVKDPFSGDIHGPGAIIKPDGTVQTDEEWKAAWIERNRLNRE